MSHPEWKTTTAVARLWKPSFARGKTRTILSVSLCRSFFWGEAVVVLYLGQSLVQAVDHLCCLWVREGQRIWPESHDIPVLAMQSYMRKLGASTLDIDVSPDISEVRPKRAREGIQ